VLFTASFEDLYLPCPRLCCDVRVCTLVDGIRGVLYVVVHLVVVQ